MLPEFGGFSFLFFINSTYIIGKLDMHLHLMHFSGFLMLHISENLHAYYTRIHLRRHRIVSRIAEHLGKDHHHAYRRSYKNRPAPPRSAFSLFSHHIFRPFFGVRHAF